LPRYDNLEFRRYLRQWQMTRLKQFLLRKRHDSHS